MTDKEVEIIDGVIRGILAFLSNPKNELILFVALDSFGDERFREDLFRVMDAPQWLICQNGSSLTAMMNWQQCVDHALMILSMEYQYER